MESVKIEKLVHKYLEAETSLEEEAILKNYFSQENIPLHLQEYQPMFTYFSQSAKLKSTQKIALPQEKRKYHWLRIAAIAIFFVSIFSVYQKNVNERKQAQQAYADTQRALQMISFTLNKGNRAVAQLETFEKAQNKIFKTNNTK
jgi:hypothetical protein